METTGWGCLQDLVEHLGKFVEHFWAVGVERVSRLIRVAIRVAAEGLGDEFVKIYVESGRLARRRCMVEGGGEGGSNCKYDAYGCFEEGLAAQASGLSFLSSWNSSSSKGIRTRLLRQVPTPTLIVSSTLR
eukprot:6186320-Pleurochrysis_carterae.AAC.1